MKIIKPYHEIINVTQNPLQLIELAGRNCYKSEDKITPDSAHDFIRRAIKAGHLSLLEHASATVRIICDRGISHEIVRHRIGVAYSQESTRYCRYSDDKFGNQITVILPIGFDERMYDTEWTPLNSPPDNFESNMHVKLWETLPDVEKIWLASCRASEFYYALLIERGSKPEIARSVLPTSLKTEIIMTANFRAWKWIFRQRCQKAAHPQIREIMLPLLKELHEKIHVVFDEEFEMFKETINGKAQFERVS